MHKPSGFAHILLLVIILGVGAVVAGGGLALVSTQSESTPAPSLSPTETLKEAEVAYTPEIVTFSDEEYEFTFQYDSNKWYVYTEADTGVTGITISDVDTGDRQADAEYNGMSINVEDISEYSIEQVRTELLPNTESQLPPGTLVQDVPTKVGDYLTDKFTITQNGRSLYLYYGYAEDTLIIATMAALNEEKVAEFEDMMQTIQLK